MAGRRKRPPARPPWDGASRSNVRRERPDPVVDLLRRARPVELAVGRADLLGVRGLTLLWEELALGERLVDELRSEPGRLRENVSRGLVAAEPEVVPGADR